MKLLLLFAPYSKAIAVTTLVLLGCWNIHEHTTFGSETNSWRFPFLNGIVYLGIQQWDWLGPSSKVETSISYRPTMSHVTLEDGWEHQLDQSWIDQVSWEQTVFSWQVPYTAGPHQALRFWEKYANIDYKNSKSSLRCCWKPSKIDMMWRSEHLENPCFWCAARSQGDRIRSVPRSVQNLQWFSFSWMVFIQKNSAAFIKPILRTGKLSCRNFKSPPLFRGVWEAVASAPPNSNNLKFMQNSRVGLTDLTTLMFHGHNWPATSRNCPICRQTSVTS